MIRFTHFKSFIFVCLSCSLDGQPMLLPPGQVQELNTRSTGILNNAQRFFAHHLIEIFGCDYSTSGVTLEALQAKIKSFLELRTADGPRHDTYVIFYSGHTHRTGEWALAGERSINFVSITDLSMLKKNTSCGCTINCIVIVIITLSRWATCKFNVTAFSM